MCLTLINIYNPDEYSYDTEIYFVCGDNKHIFQGYTFFFLQENSADMQSDTDWDQDYLFYNMANGKSCTWKVWTF